MSVCVYDTVTGNETGIACAFARQMPEQRIKRVSLVRNI